MSIFSNLLKDLAVQPANACNGDCYDTCTGVSSDQACISQCTSDCEGSSLLPPGGEGGGEVCIVCGASCSISCTFGCGAYTCGISCSSYSTGK